MVHPTSVYSECALRAATALRSVSPRSYQEARARLRAALDEETDPRERACADAVYQAEFNALLGSHKSTTPEPRIT